MKALLSVAELVKRIDHVNGAANKLQAEYQEVGVLCLQHLKAHGDVGPINRLVVGMPKGTRRLAMATWAVAWGALVPNQDQGTRDTMPLRYTKEKETDPEGAEKEMWYEAAPERQITDVFDLQVAVKALLNRAKGKHLKIGGEDKPHEAHSMLKMLAVGVGLPNPFPEDEKQPVDGANPGGIEGGQPPAGSQSGITRQTPSGTAAGAVAGAVSQPADSTKGDKPAVKREARATASKGAAKKASGRAKAHA